MAKSKILLRVFSKYHERLCQRFENNLNNKREIEKIIAKLELISSMAIMELNVNDYTEFLGDKKRRLYENTFEGNI